MHDDRPPFAAPRRAATVALLLAPLLSFALLGAHFYRAGSWPLTLASVVLMALLAWPRPWVARLAQVALAMGALEWAWTTLQLVQQRQAFGLPWLRLALILGSVAALAALAVFVFEHRWLKARFGLR